MGTDCTNTSNQNLNDINISKTEDSPSAATFFVIEYDTISRLYSLKDMDRGTGTFLRIEKPMPLRDGIIVSFGDSHMLVSISSNSQDIDLKFIDGPKFDTNVKYSITDKIILIGRMPE